MDGSGLLKKAAMVLSGNTVHSALLFLRNILVARLIGVEDYGIAATFAIAMAVVEMATQLGLHQLIVQDNRGEEERFQSGLQGVHFLRSMIMAAVLIFFGPDFAAFLELGDIGWAFQILAIPIIARGLWHFDIYRLQRRMEFLPVIVTQVGPPALALLAVLPFAWWFGDYRVMLFSIIMQEILLTLTSHIVAERRYRLTFDLDMMWHAFRFGWPLMLNGVVLFALFHGERLVVAREFDLVVLGIFSMAVTVTMTPGMTFSRTYDSIFLPWFSAVKDDKDTFASRVYTAMEAAVVMGLIFGGAVLVVVTPIILLIVGVKYEPIIALMPWLAISMAVRLFRAGPMVAALAMANTQSMLVINVIRVMVLPLSWYAAVNGGSVITVIVFGIVGELLSLAAGLWVLRSRLQIPLRPAMPVLCTGLFCVLVLGIHEYSIRIAGYAFTDPMISKAAVVAAGLVCLVTCRRLISLAWTGLRAQPPQPS